MRKIHVIRAEFGQYTQAFYDNGYIGISWSLKGIEPNPSKENIEQIYRKTHPDLPEGNVRINVGQIYRFFHEIKIGDIVLSPKKDNYIIVGEVISGVYNGANDTSSPFPYRYKVNWRKDPINRHTLSIPLQNSLRSSLTLFEIRNQEEILKALGEKISEQEKSLEMSEHIIYERIRQEFLRLDAYEFELLVSYVLRSLGFQATQATGKVGDGGIDFEGMLEVSGVASVKLQMQVKRYSDNVIGEKEIRNFRGALKRDFQGTFITLSNYNKKARESASDDNHVLINLIDGTQFIDLFIEQYENIRDLLIEDDQEGLLKKLQFKKILLPLE